MTVQGKSRILFVCTGNSCRSVMAEGLLRHLLREKGRSAVQVISAGTNTMPGMGPTPETIEVMQAEGVDVTAHQSQQLTPDLVQRADVIFCMEDFHRDQILSVHPEDESKVHLLRTFRNTRPEPDPNVSDPIGRPRRVYETCLATIKEGVQRVVEWLEEA